MISIFGLGVHPAVELIEPPRHFAGQLNVGNLVFTDRDGVGAERQDVRGLTHGIQRKAKGIIVAQILDLDLILQSRIAHHAVVGQQHGEQVGELRNRWHFRLQEDRRLLGIESHGQIVTHDLQRVATDLVVLFTAGGERMHVGNQHKAFGLALQFDAPADRTDPVAKVELSGRGITGEHATLRHDESSFKKGGKAIIRKRRSRSTSRQC